MLCALCVKKLKADTCYICALIIQFDYIFQITNIEQARPALPFGRGIMNNEVKQPCQTDR
jgi:hypothetical protein